MDYAALFQKFGVEVGMLIVFIVFLRAMWKDGNQERAKFLKLLIDFRDQEATLREEERTERKEMRAAYTETINDHMSQVNTTLNTVADELALHREVSEMTLKELRKMNGR